MDVKRRSLETTPFRTETSSAHDELLEEVYRSDDEAKGPRSGCLGLKTLECRFEWRFRMRRTWWQVLVVIVDVIQRWSAGLVLKEWVPQGLWRL